MYELIATSTHVAGLFASKVTTKAAALGTLGTLGTSTDLRESRDIEAGRLHTVLDSHAQWCIVHPRSYVGWSITRVYLKWLIMYVHFAY